MQAEELLARKRAQLEEASRAKLSAQQAHAAAAHTHPHTPSSPDPARDSLHAAAAGGAGASPAETADQDRLKRAEVFRQVCAS